jgi:ferredoxin
MIMTRAPVANFLTEDFQKTMNRIENCQRCGHCTSGCPYNLDTPALLEKNLHWYRDFIAKKRQNGEEHTRRKMEQRISAMKAAGIDVEFHMYPNVGYGFGLGIGTCAKGWLNKAVSFWGNHIK